MKRWGVSSVAWCLGAYWAFAGDGAWNVDSDGLWTNEANWVDSEVADGFGATVYFTNSVTARRTVTIDQPVTLEALRFGSPSYNNWRLTGDGPITLDGNAKPRIGSSVNQRVEIFTPLSGTNGFTQESLPGDIELDGDNSGLAGLAELKAYTVVQSMSKSATSTDEVVRDYFPTGGVLMSGARLELYGRKNGSAVSSSWVLSEGRAQVWSESLTATASLAPGQPVTGTGLPDGTFVRQILDGSNLVLSAAAEQSVTSTLSFAAAAFRSEQLLQRVRLDGSQDFKIHRNGGTSFTTEVERVYGAANWALKYGDAVVKIPGQREHRGVMQLHTVDLALVPKTVTRQPAPGAAFHVDASRADTLTVVSGNKVAEWRDADGKDLYAKMPTTVTNNWPTFMDDELNGMPVVDYGTFGVSPYMHWFNAEGQTQLSNIRAVFWVLGSQNGGGFLLGGTNTAHFHRGNAPDGVFYPIKASSRMWDHDWNTYPGGGRVETYIDGIRRDQTAALNGGYQLISCIIATNVTGAGFATDRNLFSDRRGGQRLAEVLIYERPLTDLERVETEEYLTAKWFGDTRWDADGKAPAVTELNVLGTRTVSTPASGVTALGHLSGSGTLTKSGGSTLALSDAQDYLGTLALGEGGLNLTAAAVPEEPASNAYFHVDASVTNAFVFDGDGRILSWQDWRGNGRAATVQDGFATPSLTLDALNGKPVVDFGALGSLQALSWNHTNNAIKAAFLVFQSVGSTSSILGGVTNQPQDFYRGSAGQLYNTDATASRAAVYGANYVNGWHIEPMVSTLPSGFCVVSVIPTTDARAGAFAMDRHYTARSGGQRLAEAIVYTRSLTDLERRDTEAYLMRKWLGRAAPGYGAPDTPQVGAVTYAGSALDVTVDGDGAAAIGQLSGGGTVVKSGSGSLVLGSGYAGFAGAVQVDEGAVSASAPDAGAPASGAVFHVDASQTNTMTLVEENGTNFITRWSSLASVSNAAVERAGYLRPYLLTNDLAGMAAVGFGPFGVDGSCLKWETGVTTVRSVFMVLGSQEGGGFILGSQTAAHFHRGNRGSTFMPITKDNVMFGWDVSPNVYNGAVYLDGARVAPLSKPLSGGYQLIEILTTDATTADVFAGDRDSTPGRGGGQRLAEVLIYDRPVTERERLQTESYLLNKWFGGTTAGAGLGTVVVTDGSGIAAEVSPMTVNRLVGTGTVIKTGDETLTLADTTAFTGTVDVANGTLNLAVPSEPLTPPTNPLFWTDASKAGTIDTDVSGNVTEWRDASGNGRYATPVPGRTPTLRGNDFAGRPVVDMGPYGITGSAGMYWNERITGMKSIAWVLGSQLSGGYLLGATNNGTSFHRGPPPEGGGIYVTNFTYRNYMLSGSWGAIIPAAAYTNGVVVNTQNTGLSGGYQLLYMVWSNNVTYADGFAFDRTFGDRYGGQRLAEFIAYDRVLTDQERLDLHAYLNRKWFGLATEGYTPPETHTGVILRDDTSLTMNGMEQSVISLSGSGSVSNGTLVVTETLSPGLGEGDVVTLPVSGNLTLAEGVTVEIDYPRPDCDAVTVSGTLSFSGGGTLAVRLPAPPGSGLGGRVPVMTFGTLDGVVNLASWEVTGLPPAYSGGLVAEEQTVYLEIRAKGILLMLR